MQIVILFPGQGSQNASMFDEDSLWENWRSDWSSLKSSIPATKEELIAALNSTEVTQPAIVGYSYHAFKKIEPLLSQHQIIAVAGHSLGELTATAISLGWGVDLAMGLAQCRGKLMQQACDNLGEKVGMQAWLGRTINKSAIRELLSKKRNLWLLNDNGPSQIVVGGVLQELSPEELASCGVTKSITLPVSVVSHCPLLEAMLPSWRTALSLAPWKGLSYPIFNHTTVKYLQSPAETYENLSQQLTHEVKFQEMIEKLSISADLFIEVGPSQVLKGLVTKITTRPCLSLSEAIAEFSATHSAVRSRL